MLVEVPQAGTGFGGRRDGEDGEHELEGLGGSGGGRGGQYGRLEDEVSGRCDAWAALVWFSSCPLSLYPSLSEGHVFG